MHEADVLVEDEDFEEFEEDRTLCVALLDEGVDVWGGQPVPDRGE